MDISNYPTDSIHLPSHSLSVRILQITSTIGAGLTLFITLCLFINFLFPISVINALFGNSLNNIPAIFLLLTNCLVIFFYNKLKEFMFIIVGTLNCVIGIATLANNLLINLGLFSFLSAVNINAGLLFLLLGLALLITASPANHRFHYAQLILFFAALFGIFRVLQNIYQFVSTGQLTTNDNNYFAITLLLLTLSQAFFLTKVNRGFIGLFITDTHSSQLSRLSLLYYISVPPFLGLVFLLIERLGFINDSGRLALLVIAEMIMAVIITWINVKLLYPLEVRDFLTKESLRINNITLKLDTKDLASRMQELEKDKDQMAAKLNNQQTLMDIVDGNE